MGYHDDVEPFGTKHYANGSHHRTLEAGSPSHVDERTIITIVWVALLVAFLVGPCCINRRRRKTCLRRIRERRFHVEVEEETEEQWFVAAMERYRAAAQASETLSAENRSNSEDRQRKKHEDDECRRILLERLSKFATTLHEEQIIEGSINESFFDEADEKDQKETENENDKGMILLSRRQGDIETGAMDDSEAKKSANDEEGKDEKFLQTASTYRKVLLPRPGVPISESSTFANEERPTDELDVEQPEKLETATNERKPCGLVDIDQCREVRNGCAVCLEPLIESERVCWSSNTECPHVFHEQCIVDWLAALGRRKRRIRRESEGEQSDGDTGVADFPMLCPCCRQDFMMPGAN